MSTRMKQLLFFGFTLLVLGLAACTAAPEPPATIQAIAAETDVLAQVNLGDVEVLQDRPLGGGQVVLYQWQNNTGATCLATSQLTLMSGEWKIRDTASVDCYTPSKTPFVAAYTGNSHLEAPFGPPRHTTVYGTSSYGSAIQIVWSDGQVSHVPLENGSFLEARAGRWGVERIELLDGHNNLLFTEDWGVSIQLSN